MNLSKRVPKVTIVIPLYVIVERFFEDLKKFSALKYQNYEIILVSDRKVSAAKIGNARLILTHKSKTGPAEKRDIALKHAKGEFCAFIDDDAYPHSKWLSSAIKNFKNKKVVAVGGPGITPPEDGYWEKLSGLIYESFFCSGATQNRFVSLKSALVEDWPAYNLVVRKDILKKVGGYGNDFYGGEDTFLCNKLISEGDILYEPQAIVYHHRRKLFFDLLKQIANVGLHRGYFAKRYPQTSRKWFYFLPSSLTISFFSFLLISLFYTQLLPFFAISLIIFIVIGAISVADKTNLVSAFIAGIGIILVHLSYGSFFIKGLLIKKLSR